MFFIDALRFALRAGFLLAAVSAVAAAAEFRSVGENAAILYDAPSAKSKKLFVVGHDYPLEIVVIVEGWTKVRDANGELAWIESRRLAEKRMLIVTAPVAQVRETADDHSPIVFQAQQSVLLEMLEVTGGWIRVRHPDGQAGYVKASQVWGA